jgi:hypothetical protein
MTTYPEIQKISSRKFGVIDFISKGPNNHGSYVNANKFVKRNIDHIAPSDAKNILIFDFTWFDNIDHSLLDYLRSGKAPYDYILMCNLFDGWLETYREYYLELKEHYQVNIIGPQPIEPENFFNFHEYNVASWKDKNPDLFYTHHQKFNELHDLDTQILRYPFLYYGGGISKDRLQFVTDCVDRDLIIFDPVITLGLEGSMSDAQGQHYPDSLGDPGCWIDSVVNIVSESRSGRMQTEESSDYFLTEKTYKPILAFKPFIHINQPKMFTDYMKDSCGYKLYNSFFGLPDYEPTNQQVVDSLWKISNMSNRDRNLFYKSMLPTIEHNYQNLQTRADRISKMFIGRNA